MQPAKGIWNCGVMVMWEEKKPTTWFWQLVICKLHSLPLLKNGQLECWPRRVLNTAALELLYSELSWGKRFFLKMSVDTW